LSAVQEMLGVGFWHVALNRGGAPFRSLMGRSGPRSAGSPAWVGRNDPRRISLNTAEPDYAARMYNQRKTCCASTFDGHISVYLLEGCRSYARTKRADRWLGAILDNGQPKRCRLARAPSAVRSWVAVI